MTDEEMVNRAHRAKGYREEFLDPIVSGIRKEYAERMLEIASKELNPRRRERAITSLSVAIRILNNIESGINAVINDGEVARRKLDHARVTEGMSKPDRRLLDIVPH